MMAVAGMLPQIVHAGGPDCAGGYDYREDCDFLKSCRCQRPHRIKIIVNRPIITSSGSASAAAASAPASAPVYTLPTYAAIIVPASAPAAAPAAAAAQAGLSDEDIRRIVAAMRKEDAASAQAAAAAPAGCAPAAARAAAGSSQTCQDACGDIRQLKRDVADLIVLTNNLADAVQKISSNR